MERPRPRRSAGPDERTPLIRRKLLRWYRKNRRALPWRETRDPYAVWVSEIMLQQTRVETVIPYYRRFMERFPDAASLADASPDEVLKVWENLGYYSRARNLHEAAKIVAARHGGLLPEPQEDLAGLPGIGEYTAGAIGSIAFGLPVPAVDGNVRRVLARVYAIGEPVATGTGKSRIRALAAGLVSPEDPGAFNQALMDLGSGICTPAFPRCPECPLADVCEAFRQGRQEALPVTSPKKTLPCESAVAAVLRDRDGRFLVVRRPPRGFLGGLWKFPGGFLRPGEDLREGLRRTVREETGIRVSILEELVSVNTVYSHFRLLLTAFHCRKRGGGSAPPEGPGRQWATFEEMNGLAFSKADRLLFPAVQVLRPSR
ncbi:MAG: A/G-specific adenine glycosylase [Syntrophaceae bacterium]|nr:A/G-specific adenine glycosylase [Syntrophaceae bacterium]